MMIARIQSASSVRFAALPFQNATFVPTDRGCPFRSFFLWFAEGPTEFVRGGSVIETPRVFAPEPGPGVPIGDEALGRLIRLSVAKACSPPLALQRRKISKPVREASGALRNATRTVINSSDLSRSLDKSIRPANLQQERTVKKMGTYFTSASECFCISSSELVSFL